MIEEMEDEAIEFQDKIRGLDKEVKDWQIYNFIRLEVQRFRDTMPLLSELRDDSMRDRHWRELRFEVKDDFDQTGDDFTLEKLFNLNLLAHADKIYDIGERAKKQLKIEISLNNIENMWEKNPKSDLNMISQKSKGGDNEEYWIIGSTDNIMELIEQHGLELGNFKSSPFYKEFDQKIDLWEGYIA